MNQPHEVSFDAQMERIKLMTGKKTQIELAHFLGVRQSSISDAMRRGKIPSSWLVILLHTKNVNPEWILTGKGSCFMPLPQIEGFYESGEDYAERRADEDALRRLSSRMLADELVRRIAVSQETRGASDEKSKKNK